MTRLPTVKELKYLTQLPYRYAIRRKEWIFYAKNGNELHLYAPSDSTSYLSDDCPMVLNLHIEFPPHVERQLYGTELKCLVSDKPCKNFIDIDGTYWSTKSESGKSS